MKKYISMMAMALMLCMSFTACDVETDEKPGGTNIQDMCGNWDVAWYAVDASGNILDEEPWTEGTIFTFNKADNGTTQMWISDQATYWQFQFLVNIDYAAKTFSAPATYYGPDMEEIAALIASGVTTDSKGNPYIFDFKWTSSSKRHASMLEENKSVQLTLYKELVSKENRQPHGKRPGVC